jgi:hypothetical protein
MAENLTPIQKQFMRHGMLKTERASWMPHWMEISTYLLPRNGRYYPQDRDRGIRKHNAIYDSTGTRALKTLAAGLMSGVTSPARPWFRLGVEDQDLMKSQDVKVWLDQVRSIMLNVFAKSNTYLTLHSIYEDLGCFGTSASIVMDDYDSVLHHYHSPNGEYCLGNDYRGNVNALTREFQKTVGELVGEFGYANCSTTVRNLFDRGSYDQWVSIVHVVEPREDRDPAKLDARNKRFTSNYFELGRDKDSQYLRESGMERFKVLAPRWQKMSGDIYGMSPGMEALGDVKQLQHEQLRKANAIDYQTKPPLQVPTSMKNKAIEQLPGGITYVDATSQSQQIRTAFDVNLNLQYLLNDIQDVRGRINSAFYADLFLMISQQPADGQMTATEVAERHEEKLLILGPVLERLHNELLNPLIDMTFERMIEADMLPPPPEELAGHDVQVEFISTLAQAQRAIATNGLDRFVGNLGAVAQFKPEVLDKFDADKWADVYSDALGIDPELILANDKVAMVRDQRAQAQAKQAQAEQVNQIAQAAQRGGAAAASMKSAGVAPQDVLGGVMGYNSSNGVGV